MSEPHVIAIDIDLGRVTAVSSAAGVLCHGQPWQEGNPLPFAHLYLIEVAGPILHHEESHSYRRWMIFNSMLAALLASQLETEGYTVLVAASTAWTEGYPEPERHAIAGILPVKYKTVKGKKVPIYKEAHDIRECRTMLDFYRKCPKHWVPLDQYLQSLCPKGTS